MHSKMSPVSGPAKHSDEILTGLVGMDAKEAVGSAKAKLEVSPINPPLSSKRLDSGNSMQVPLTSAKYLRKSPAPVPFIDTATIFQGLVTGLHRVSRLSAQ